MSALYLVDPEESIQATNAGAQPTDFGDIAGASFDSFLKNSHALSSEMVYREAETRQDEQYRKDTGNDFNELLEPEFVKQSRDLRRPLYPFEKRKIRDEMIGNQPGLQFPQQSLKGFARNIVEESDQALATAKMNAGAGTMIGTASFTGGLAAAASDPINLATMLLGAGAGKTILQTMFVEASIGAGTELVQAPGIYAWQKKMGKEYGLGEFATNLAFGAIGGAAFAGLIKSPSAIYNKLKNEAEGLKRDALASQEQHQALLEYWPEGVTRAEHIENQKKFNNQVVESHGGTPEEIVKSRNAVEQMVEGDVTLQIPSRMKPLNAAVRAASETPGKSIPKIVDDAVHSALTEQAAKSVSNMKGKKLEHGGVRTLEGEIAKLKDRLGRSDEWYEKAARARLEQKSPGSMSAGGGSGNHHRRRARKKAIAHEIAAMKRADEASIELRQDKLNVHRTAVRADKELAALKAGNVPARLEPARIAAKGQLEHAAAVRAKHGDELLAKMNAQRAGDLERLNLGKPKPLRTVDEIVEDIEVRESPEHSATLDADTARIQENPELDQIWSEELGGWVDTKDYMARMDDSDIAESEALNTCAVGGIA